MRFVHEELLLHWGLERIATWVWVKVTNSGELVTPLVRFPIVSALLCLSGNHHDQFSSDLDCVHGLGCRPQTV